jgi:YhhN-like protein
VLSDSTLALERFDAALSPPHAALLVMLTYVLAQASIVSGLAGRREPAPPAAVLP